MHVLFLPVVASPQKKAMDERAERQTGLPDREQGCIFPRAEVMVRRRMGRTVHEGETAGGENMQVVSRSLSFFFFGHQCVREKIHHDFVSFPSLSPCYTLKTLPRCVHPGTGAVERCECM